MYEEWLIAYPKGKAQTWFERPVEDLDDPEQWYFGPNLKGEKKRLVSLLRQDTPFLSVAAQFSHKQLTTIYNWFGYHLRIVWPETRIENAEGQFAAELVRDNQEIREIISLFLKKADLGISEILVDTNPETEYLEVNIRHQVQGNDESGVVFPLENESRGTRRVFILIGPWIAILVEGYTVIVDELESSLHPMLARMLIKMFHDSEVSDNAQLVFNTHNTTLLDNELFRRDQIWFVEKDEGGASRLYPLLEFSPRKDEALAKGYLQGRYGAIPFLGSLEGFVLNAKA